MIQIFAMFYFQKNTNFNKIGVFFPEKKKPAINSHCIFNIKKI